MPENSWYHQGLSFTCAQCGNCCSGAPGYVWVTTEEQQQIAQALGCPDGRIPSEYIRRVGFRFSLTERPNGDCVLLIRHGPKAVCRVYESRPLQCRTWPFWTINLKSPDHWAAAAGTCPGMNHGTWFDALRIDEIREKNGW